MIRRGNECRYEIREHMREGDGQVVVTGQSYKSKSGCLSGIDSVRKNAPDAPTVEENFE